MRVVKNRTRIAFKLGGGTVLLAFAVPLSLHGYGFAADGKVNPLDKPEADTQTAADPGWPGWRGPNRDGRSADRGLLKEWPEGGPKLLWKATGIGAGYSSPAIVDGMVYISGNVGDDLVLRALDMDGKEKWRVGVDKAWKRQFGGAYSSPVCSDGVVYLLSNYGRLKAYDAKTGHDKWQVDIKKEYHGRGRAWGYAESPLVARNAVFVTPGGHRATMVALDRKTGKRIWTSTGLHDSAGHSSAIVVDFQEHPVLIQNVSGGMVGIDAVNGRFLWRCVRAVRTKKASEVCATPVYADGYAFAATGYRNGGACVKLSVRDGKVDATQVWETKDMICHHGGYVVHEGHIYGNHVNGWSCLELATGTKKWFANGVGKGSVCFADGMLYTFAEKGGRIGLVEAVPDGFRMRGEFRVEGQGPSWAYPVVTGGRLYLRYDDNLYCFDVRGPEYKVPAKSPLGAPDPTHR